MLKFWIAIYFLSGYCEGTSFLTRPKNITVEKGAAAEFPCKVDFGTTVFQGIQWVFNDKRLYSFEKGHEDYSNVDKTFQVNQDGKNFNLTVRDLRFDDGGKYTCKILSDQATALLTVVGMPQISYDSVNAIEGGTSQFKCTAQFSGPSEGDTLNYPNLQMFFDGRLLNGTAAVPKYDSSADQFNIILVRNITLEGRMHAEKLVCGIGTSGPATHINASTEITVLYPVRNVTYTPQRERYYVGSNITCTAEGNPKPVFWWSDTQNKGDVINGAVLVIAEKMIGSNVWECTANNTINGKSHQKTSLAVFDVDPITEVYGGKSGNDSGIIAAAVIIPVLILIISLTAFLFYTKYWKQRKQKKEQQVKGQKNTSDKEESQREPLINQANDPNVSAVIEHSPTTAEAGCLCSLLWPINSFNVSPDRRVGRHAEPKPTVKHVAHPGCKENTVANHPKDDEGQAKAPEKTSTDTADSKVGTPAEPKQRGKESEVASQPKEDGSQAKALKETNPNIPIDCKVGTPAKPKPSGKESEVASQPKEDGTQAEALKETSNVPGDGKVGPTTKPKPAGNIVRKRIAQHEAMINNNMSDISADRKVERHTEPTPDANPLSHPVGKDITDASHPKEKEKPVGPLDHQARQTDTSSVTVDLSSQATTKPQPTGSNTLHQGDEENTDVSKENQAKSSPGHVKKQKDLDVPDLGWDLAGAVEEAVKEELKLNPKAVVVKDLRNGNFGEIMSGTYRGENVALKICEETRTDDQKKAFFNDFFFLQKYDHENIAKFLGITVTVYPIIVIIQSEQSALLRYLKEPNIKQKLNYKSLTQMCLDVLEAMIYLEKEQCIHRDIACRNCVIGKTNSTVKICNFFMAREEKEGPYEVDEKEPVQVRWAAPEVINTRFYTLKSEIWSFGVLMWEIFSFGQTPYDGIADKDIPTHIIEGGHRLVPPDAIPDVICSQMKQCWEYTPKKRQNKLINIKRNLEYVM